MKRFAIGKHGSPQAPDEARDESRRLLALEARGEDPAGAKAASKRVPIVTELAQHYVTEHVESKRSRLARRN